MTEFEQYRLPEVPDHLHFPRTCEPYFKRLLDGTASEVEACQWPAGADPDHVIQGLQWHGIGPVLYKQSKELRELDRQPLWLRNFLRQSFLDSSARNLAIGSELTRILGSLHQAIVPVILLKGSALMRTAYEQIGLRPMVDLDLLVPADALNKASDAICRVGYRSLPTRRHFAREHHLKFVSANRQRAGFVIELHWRLSDQESLADLLPLANLWDRSVTAPAPLGTARVLDVCDQLLHAVLHLAEHYGLPRLRWLCDLHRLAMQISSDDAWQALAQRALECDLHLVLAASIQEATRWFGVNVPASFWHELAQGLPASAFAQKAFARCRAPALVDFQIQELCAIRTLHGKMAHVLDLLFPDPRLVRRRHRVPRESAVWPYYLLRLGNGLRTSVQRIFKHSPNE